MRKYLLAALPAVALFATAASADMATVEARQAYFKSLGGVMKTLTPLAKEGFNAEIAAAEAAKLQAILATDTAPLFAPGTSDADFPGKSRAMAKIWDNMGDFGAKGKAMHEAGAELIAVASAGDAAAFPAAFGKFGGTCKACHDDYRVPE